MSLWSKHFPQKNKKKTLLLRVHDSLNVSENPFRKSFFDPEYLSKETSFFIPAGITIEAAIALTVFLLFCASLLSMFNVLGQQVVKSYELEERSQRDAMLAELLPDCGNDIISTQIYRDSYLFVPKLLSGTNVVMHAVRRAWTGRTLNDKTENSGVDAYVYVAEHGSVYHVSESCTHLWLSIRKTLFSTLQYLRNNSGAIYKPCERCCGDQKPTEIFITDEGTRYHCSTGCSGLKRRYGRVLLSECDLPPCSRCAADGTG